MSQHSLERRAKISKALKGKRLSYLHRLELRWAWLRRAEQMIASRRERELQALHEYVGDTEDIEQWDAEDQSDYRHAVRRIENRAQLARARLSQRRQYLERLAVRAPAPAPKDCQDLSGDFPEVPKISGAAGAARVPGRNAD